MGSVSLQRFVVLGRQKFIAGIQFSVSANPIIQALPVFLCSFQDKYTHFLRERFFIHSFIHSPTHSFILELFSVPGTNPKSCGHSREQTKVPPIQSMGSKVMSAP